MAEGGEIVAVAPNPVASGSLALGLRPRPLPISINRTIGCDCGANLTPHYPGLHLLPDPTTRILSLGNKRRPYFSFGSRNKPPRFKGGTLVTPRSFHIGSTVSAWQLVCSQKTWRSNYPGTLFASELVVNIEALGEACSPSSDHFKVSGQRSMD